MNPAQCLIVANCVVIVSMYGAMAFLPNDWIVATPLWMVCVVWGIEWLITLTACVWWSVVQFEREEYGRTGQSSEKGT